MEKSCSTLDGLGGIDFNRFEIFRNKSQEEMLNGAKIF
jgi:hypothetical protein